MSEQRKVVTASPENSETPLDQVCGWVTPNRLFFVRNHFDVPELTLDNWRLRIGGLVDHPLELTWNELQQFPQRSVFSTMECAGNGRSYLQEKVHGVQWGAGAIGHAEWSGVPLYHVLKKAGLKSGVQEIVFEGYDEGTEADHPATMSFARGLPVSKAQDPDTLLAFRMNGELLDPIHGFPVRLLVPGWYGVASVKWLKRIEAIDHAFGGYYQTKKYTLKRETANGEETVVVGPMAVKCEIVRPRPDEVLGIGTNRLFGVAWAGPDSVAKVEVSVDGGIKWFKADLIGQRSPYSWTMWEYLWEVAEAGECAIRVRATSESGQTQPETHNLANGGYQIHFVRPRSVRIEATREVRDKPSNADLLQYDMNAFAEDNTRFPLDVEMEFSAGAGI